MFKRIIFVGFLLSLLASCYEPKRNCADYRTGEFIFNYKIGDTAKTARFVRNEKYSVDYFDDQIDSSTVRWINDCEFVLQDLKSKVGIHYKIISTTDSSYTFEYKTAIKDPNRPQIVKTGTAYKAE
ncbi:hypothetical protein J8L85_12215 [Maribacter sp. MMG018]|uniref:hypothetical protein n=1 Tax=Maribacter sp. MMG018 TaxID=2822688 RepID=UPI001B377467|nr:hypothetical protein [Maribacter sp. MMG018]MBQ4915209.1 hypothetical protein [Maribacter sp. MMG018]